MGMEALLPIGGQLLGGLMGSDAASDAADAQVGATKYATDIADKQFNKQLALNEPFRQGGVAGMNQLLMRLGINPGQGQSAQPVDRNAIRARLLPQYTRTAPGTEANFDEYATFRPGYQAPNGMSTVDENGLNAAIEREVGDAPLDSGLSVDPNDPQFGSLMRDFGMRDFQEDPGYKFRMDQGLQAQARGASASGRLGSGRYLKDLTAFGQGLGAQEYGNAFNRFQINRGNKLNPLMALAGIGQTATGQQQQASQNYANTAGNLATQGGNARASGYVGSANALGNALGGAANTWQGNRLLSAFNAGGTGYGGYEPWRTSGNGFDM